MQFVYSHGYAIPENVKREPKVPRGGTYTTRWKKRGTYDAALPGFALGSDEGAGGDAITNFGRDVADIALRQVAAAPPAQRKAVLQEIFTGIDPKLWRRVNRLGDQFEMQGMSSAVALRRAIAAASSQGLLEEFQRVGRQGVIKRGGLAGLAAYGPSAMGIWNPFSAVTGALSSGVRSAGRVDPRRVAGTIGGLACTVAGNPAGQLAAGAAGGPAGAAGAKLLGGLCAGPQQQVAMQQQARGGFPFIPVAIAGAVAVVAILVIK